MRDGLVRIVPDLSPPMGKEVSHVPKPGSEVKPEK